MREALESIPRLSINIFLTLIYKYILNNIVLQAVDVNMFIWGRLAQMVERLLYMREVLGSMPRLSINISDKIFFLQVVNVNKLAWGI